MKPSIIVFFALLVACGAFSSQAQVVPSATSGQFALSAGAMGSIFQPDYSSSSGVGTSPNRIYGVGTYVDVRFTRWIQIEAEGRWSRYNTTKGGVNEDNAEDNYLIGPRLPLHHFRFLRATPYFKALVGFANGNFLSGLALNVAYGGGVDLKMSKRISLRLLDFEYQQWRVEPTTMVPYGASVGVSYRIFGGR